MRYELFVKLYGIRTCPVLVMSLMLTVGGLPALGQQDQPEGVPCPAEPTDMTITYGQLITCQIETVGDADVFRFQGVSGERIRIELTSYSGGTPAFSLYNPAGSELASAGTPFNAIVHHQTLQATGIFTIRVSEHYDDGTMSYRLAVHRVGPPGANSELIRFAQNLPGRLDPIGDIDQYWFFGAAGDAITVSLSSTGGGTPSLWVYGPTGQQLFASGTPFNNVTARITLPADGPYSIIAEEHFADAIMTFRLDLQCVGQCPSLPLPAVAVTLTGCTTCRPGDTFSARLRVINAGSPARPAELKLGFYFPDGTPVNIADPHLELPGNFTFDGEIVRGTITAQHPQGTWRICGRLLELQLGQPLGESCSEFTVGP
jgi:hypothetical protein